MIPKVIHWVWFGDKNKIPCQFKQNLASWKRFFPDYEIKMHDENNYDVNKNPFTKEQYEKGKLSFVADFARLDIIYQEGGMYFDIDVEVIRPFDDLPEQFFGFEACTFGINLGSGFRCASGHPLYKETLNSFNTKNVIGEYFNSGIMTTEEPSLTLIKNGLVCDNTFQVIQGISMIPCDFLCPFSYNEKMFITYNTYSIHKYAMTWLDEHEMLEIIKIRNNDYFLENRNMAPIKVKTEFSYEPT
jgi:hypothetical protein